MMSFSNEGPEQPPKKSYGHHIFYIYVCTFPYISDERVEAPAYRRWTNLGDILPLKLPKHQNPYIRRQRILHDPFPSPSSPVIGHRRPGPILEEAGVCSSHHLSCSTRALLESLRP